MTYFLESSVQESQTESIAASEEASDRVANFWNFSIRSIFRKDKFIVILAWEATSISSGSAVTSTTRKSVASNPPNLEKASSSSKENIEQDPTPQAHLQD